MEGCFIKALFMFSPGTYWPDVLIVQQSTWRTTHLHCVVKPTCITESRQLQASSTCMPHKSLSGFLQALHQQVWALGTKPWLWKGWAFWIKSNILTWLNPLKRMPDNVYLETQQSKEIFGLFCWSHACGERSRTQQQHSEKPSVSARFLSRISDLQPSNSNKKWWAYNFFPSLFAYTPFHSVNFLDVLEKW